MLVDEHPYLGLTGAFVLAVGVGVAYYYGYAKPLWSEAAPESDTGVIKATATVKTGADGLTVEQRNVTERIEQENNPGSIKHLYVISPYSGQVIIYSTVKGKVTSSGKRLTPYSVEAGKQRYGGFPISIAGGRYRTLEVLQDDGTYGSSNPYIYWYDSKGIYHQHFFTGGQIIHISDQPLTVSSVTINMELTRGDVE